MQDYKFFLHHSSVPTSAQSHGEFLSIAALKYAIHVAVSAVDDEDDLRTILSYVQAMKKDKNEI